MTKAAIEAKALPTDLSFIRTLHYIQHELLFAAATHAHGNIPGMLHRLRQQLNLKQELRGRQCPRNVKSCPSKYDVRFVYKIVK